MQAALEGLRALSESDRRAVLEALDDCVHTRPLAAQEKIRRYRARRRLAALMADESGNSA